MKLDRLVGRGARAEVFATEDQRALKLYLQGIPRSTAEHEFRQASAIAATGLPVPGVFDVVDFNGRFGVLYELINGPTMTQALMAAPWKTAHHARQLAELHVQIHDRAPQQIAAVDLHAELGRQVERLDAIPQALRRNVLRRLESLPQTAERNVRLCHADLHPSNVILSATGPIIIDWVDAVRTDPVADIARTVLVMKLTPYQERHAVTRKLMRAWVNLFIRIYLKHYGVLKALDQSLVQRWLVPLAASRLTEGFTVEENHLLDMMKEP